MSTLGIFFCLPFAFLFVLSLMPNKKEFVTRLLSHFRHPTVVSKKKQMPPNILQTQYPTRRHNGWEFAAQVQAPEVPASASKNFERH